MHVTYVGEIMEKKAYVMLSLLEIALGVAVGLYFLWIPDFSLALFSFALSTFFVFLNFAIPLKIKIDREEALERYISNIELLNLAAKINKKEVQELKQDIIEKANTDLKLLSEDIIFDEWLYAWIDKKIDRCEESMKSISLMRESEWETNPQEREYYEQNRRARYKGVAVERMFITSIERLKDQINRKIVLKHIIDGIKVHLVLKDNVRGFNWKGIEEGCTILDSSSMYVDIIPSPGRVGKVASGRIVENVDEVQKMEERYKTLTSFAQHGDPLDFLSIYIDREKLFSEMQEILKERYGSYETLETLSRKQKETRYENDLNKWKNIRKELGSTQEEE